MAIKMMFEKGDKVSLKDGVKQGAYTDELGICTCVLWDEMINEARTIEKEKGFLTISEVDESSCRYQIEGCTKYYWTCDMFELV